MHTIQTLILRLWVDSEAPQKLRGALQPLADAESHPFTDEQALLDLLRQFLNSEIKKENEL